MQCNPESIAEYGGDMKSAVFFLIVSFGIHSHTTRAQVPPVNTGLGGCIDFIIYGSETLTGQVNSAGYAFAYAPSSYLDKENGVVYVQNFTCNPQSPDLPGIYSRVSQVSHEMGHAVFDASFPLGTREDYIEKACTNEGRAVLNNATARSEILNTTEGYSDIGLAAANSGTLLALINAGGQNLDKRVGDLFCDTNVTSTTGVNYKIHWGNVYDELYGPEEEEEQ
ncbi:hypothetical protein [Stenotrophomonas lactitubi]|uniref:hypothetical protein n=1 Tax=Stenotrophomonas lactitubi TaxID=2045214 RepID=UPI003D16B5BC